MDKPKIDLSLYVVTDRYLSGKLPPGKVVEQAIQGGATCIQLRDKEGDGGDLFKIALELKEITQKRNITFIINDRLDIALAVKADGVHLGQEDLPAGIARRIMPPEMILGVSANTVQQALEAQEAGASYLGIGPVFSTTTKTDARPPIGLGTLSEICSTVDIPVVGIGGIDAGNAGLVIEAGAQGVAVVSFVVGAEDIIGAAEKISRSVLKALNKNSI